MHSNKELCEEKACKFASCSLGKAMVLVNSYTSQDYSIYTSSTVDFKMIPKNISDTGTSALAFKIDTVYEVSVKIAVFICSL